MRKLLPVFGLMLLGAVALTSWVALRGFAWFGGTATVPRIPAGHAEIAFLLPATNGDTWERLVAAADNLGWDRTVNVDKSRAFVELTADVAELALWPEGSEDAKLWIRWYKISSERDEAKWIEALIERKQPPLAVIGGSTTDQALNLAQTLEKARGRWPGAAPLLLLTTATADRYAQPGSRSPTDLTAEDLPRLIKVYPERSFRFSFTNKRMAEAVLDFVKERSQAQQKPALWQPTPRRTALFAGGLMASQGWGFPTLATTIQYLRSPVLHTQAWADDRYSVDLADRFIKVFPGALGSRQIEANMIDFSTGDAHNPNPREALAVGLYLRNLGTFRDQRQILALPTAAQRAQRFLRTLARRSPTKLHNLIVVNGDAISFNSIYRDRNTAWNVQDVPVPLVFFAHRNPIDASVGFRTGTGDHSEACCSGTDDLLLYRDILEVLVQAAYENGKLVNDADHLRARLHEARWQSGRVVLDAWTNPEARPIFDSVGDRADRTGEHVVWLQPMQDAGSELAEATITVWSLGPDSAWRRVGEPLRVTYDGSGRVGS